MSLIKAGIVLTVFAAAAGATYLDGVTTWVGCVVLAIVAIVLFKIGCSISAKKARKSTFDQDENALDLILAGTTGDRPYTPTPDQG